MDISNFIYLYLLRLLSCFHLLAFMNNPTIMGFCMDLFLSRFLRVELMDNWLWWLIYIVNLLEFRIRMGTCLWVWL